MGKGKHNERSAKEERKARKQEQNRAREKGRRNRQMLDSGTVKTFSKWLLTGGFELTEVQRDGSTRP